MKRLAIILGLMLAATVASAQSVTVSGVGVQDGTGVLMTTGTWCFTGSTCIAVAGGAFSGSVTAGTGTVTVVNSSAGTVLTVPNVLITGASFNWNTYVIPANAQITGLGTPYLPCWVGAKYTNTSGGAVTYCQSYSGQASWGGGQTPASSGMYTNYGVPIFPCVAPCSYTRVDGGLTYNIVGPSGLASTNWVTAGALMPGWTSTGSGASQTDTAPGTLAATNAVTALQPKNTYVTRKTLTKVANAQLSGPSQIRLALVGDSTAYFHNEQAACYLATSMLPTGTQASAGFVGNGTAPSGFPCPTQSSNNYTLSGGATVVTGDFTHFYGGAGFNLPAGACVLWGAGGTYFNSNVNAVLYDKEPGAGTITISTNNNGAGLVQQYSGSAANASLIGAVWSQTVTLAPYTVQACASGAAVNIWNESQVNTTINGVVIAWIGSPGQNLPDFTTTASAVYTPWLAYINPDIVMNEWRLNGNWNSSCQVSGNLGSDSTPQPWSYWWNLHATEWLAANSLADFEEVGGYPYAGDTNSCIAARNVQDAAWAAANQQTFVDLYYPVNGNVTLEQNLGWIDSSTHQLKAGQLAEGALLTSILGWGPVTNYASAQDVSNTNTTTQNLHIGYYGAGLFYGTDMLVKTQRALSMSDAAGNGIGYLASGLTGTGESSNWLSPFQMSDFAGTTNSGKWLAAPGGQSGIYSAPGAATLTDWYTATLHASTGIILNGSQSLTSVQGTTGTKIPAATGSFTSGNFRSTDASGNEVDSGFGTSGGTLTGTNAGGNTIMTLASTYPSGQTQPGLVFKGSTGGTQYSASIVASGYAGLTLNTSTGTGSQSPLLFETAGVVGAILDSSVQGFGVGTSTSLASTDPFFVTSAGAVTALKINVASARKGTFACTAGGTITIANTNELATSDVIISLNTAGGTISTPPAMKTVTGGTGFTVLCGASDTSTYNYDILN